MDQNKERIQILSDVRRGELAIPEAIDRLQALAARPETLETNRELTDDRELHIIRTDLEENKVLMDIRLPLDLLDAADRVGAQISSLLARVPAGRLEKALATPGINKLLDELLSEENEHLEIYLE